MGDAKRKEEELQRAKEMLARGTSKPSVQQQCAALIIDLVATNVANAALQIGRQLKLPDTADQVQKAADHLAKEVTKLLGEPPKVLIAPAGTIPTGGIVRG